MTPHPETIHIAYTCDHNFVLPLFTAITAAVHNHPENKIVFHVIATGIEQKQMIRYVKRSGNDICFYQPPGEDLQHYDFPPGTNFTPSIFYRLYLPLLVTSGVRRMLYLDTDTIVHGDLTPLYRFDLGNTPLGATTDNQMHLREDLGFVEKADYFNSGVLLIDIPAWKNQCITEKTIAYIHAHNGSLQFPDQDALNITLKGNWTALPGRYNRMRIDVPALPPDSLRTYATNQAIIHYNDVPKPWMLGIDHPLKFIFREYYTLFARTTTGNALRKERFPHGLTHLIITKFRTQHQEVGEIMLIAFVFHYCWIAAIHEKSGPSTAALVETCYATGIRDEHAATTPFWREFSNNREELLFLAREVLANSHTSGETISFSWIPSVRKLINEMPGPPDHTVPLQIDLQIRLTPLGRRLLHFFIAKTFQELFLMEN